MSENLSTNAYDKSPDEDRYTIGPDDIHAGAHQFLLSVPTGKIDRIVFQSTCDVKIVQVFHGSTNLLYGQPREPLAGPQIVAGPGRDARPDACILKLEPPQAFHAALTTTIGYEAAADGKLVVTFYRAEDTK